MLSMWFLFHHRDAGTQRKHIVKAESPDASEGFDDGVVEEGPYLADGAV